MGICISCGEVSVIDIDGQCQVCYHNRITVNRFGKTIDKLVKKHKDALHENDWLQNLATFQLNW